MDDHIKKRNDLVRGVPGDIGALREEGWGDVANAITGMRDELQRTCEHIAGLVKIPSALVPGVHTECGYQLPSPSNSYSFCPFCGGIIKRPGREGGE